MRLVKLTSGGLKGASIDLDVTSRRLLVLGPNGAGKSTVGEAIDFAMGRQVAGVDPNRGGALTDAASGPIAVTLTFDGGQVVTRRRAMKSGRLGNASVESDVDVSTPPVTDWLGLSSAKLGRALAAFGGADPAVIKAVDDAKRDLLDARGQLRALEAVAERSRACAPDPVGPDDVQRALDELGRVQAVHAEWQVETRRLNGLLSTHVDAERIYAEDFARLKRETEGHRVAINRIRDAEPVAAIRERVKALAASRSEAMVWRDAAAEWLSEMRREADNARQDLAVATADRERLTAAGETLAQAGHCPTCGGAVDAEARARIKADLDRVILRGTAADDRLCAALSLVDDARREGAEAGAAFTELAETEAGVETELAQAATYEAAGGLDGAQARLQSSEAALARLVKPEPADDIRQRAEVLRAAEPVLHEAKAAHRDVADRRAAHVRWRNDMKRRDEAEAAVETAKADVFKALATEQIAVTAGADKLMQGARPFMPHGWAPVYNHLAGMIGVRLDDDVFVGGAGLSGAQRLALGVAFASSATADGDFRYLVVEADAFDGATLAATMDALQADSLDLAVVVTCHRPPVLPAGWQVVVLGCGEPIAASPAEPLPHARVFAAPPNPHRVRAVARKMGAGLLYDLRMWRRSGAPPDDASVSAIHLAGFCDAAGALVTDAVDIALEPAAEPTPPPEGAGMTEAEARRAIRSAAPSTSAMRAALGVDIGPAGGPHVRCVKALASIWARSGRPVAELLSELGEHMAEHQKKRRGA